MSKPNTSSSNECTTLIDVEDGHVLFEAEFNDEKRYMDYRTLWFVLLCLGLTLCYGVGFLGLLWLPVMHTIWRQDYRNRRLFITPENVVFKTNVPVCCPCFGSTKREKHILLSLVTDVILEQGCLQSRYGLHSVKLENAGRQGGGDANNVGADVNIVGISNAKVFKQAVLAAAAAKRNGMHLTAELIQASLTNGYAAGFPVATPAMGFAAAPHAAVAAAPALDPALLQNLYEAQQESNRTLRQVADLLGKAVQTRQ